MAYTTLAEWAAAFLKATSKYRTTLDGLDKRMSRYTRFGGRAPGSVTGEGRTARSNLVSVCNELSPLLPNVNKATILSELDSIISKIKRTDLDRGEKVSSYYEQLSAWYEKNIKPLL